MKSCRDFKELFVDVREHVNKMLGFAKILRKVYVCVVVVFVVV